MCSAPGLAFLLPARQADTEDEDLWALIAEHMDPEGSRLHSAQELSEVADGRMIIRKITAGLHIKHDV